VVWWRSGPELAVVVYAQGIQRIVQRGVLEARHPLFCCVIA
jgi:hypothetical protein